MKNYKKFYHVNRYWFHIRNLLWFPIYLVAKIIPKKDICIFGSMSGYAIADNSKYLFIHTYKENYYWITKNKNLLSQEILHDVFPVYAYSLKGIFLQMRAKNAYYTHKIDDFVAPLIMGAKITALWHGVPFKKIGAAENHEIEISNFKKTIRRLRRKFLPYAEFMYCNEVVCPEEKFSDIYKICFGTINPTIRIEQLPRNLYAARIRKERKILYAPTCRRYREVKDVMQKTGLLSKKFFDWLHKNNYIFVVRPHPVDMDLMRKDEFDKSIQLDTSSDVYESITEYACLLTDYSSLIYDATVLAISVFLLADDVDEYISENGLFDFAEKYIKAQCKTSIFDLLPEFEKIINEAEK